MAKKLNLISVTAKNVLPGDWLVLPLGRRKVTDVTVFEECVMLHIGKYVTQRVSDPNHLLNVARKG